MIVSLRFPERFRAAGDGELDDCCRRRSYRPIRDPGRSNRPGAWHFGDLGPSLLLLLCYSSSIVSFFAFSDPLLFDGR